MLIRSHCISIFLPRYCEKVFQKNPDLNGVFLTLLRLYLHPNADSDYAPSRPPPSTSPPRTLPPPTNIPQSLLTPALELIARHSACLDSTAVLDLLPPLIPTSSVQAFLLDALDPSRLGKGEGGKMGRTIREVWKARKLEVDAHYVALRSRKVRVTDTRM